MARATHIMLDRLFAWMPRLWLSLLVLLCIACAWKPLTGGDDVWAHAAIGRWIAQHGEVPRESLFLWGAPSQPWVYHSWLSQLSFYGLLSTGEVIGAALILALTALGVSAVFVLLWRAWSTRGDGVSLWMPPVFALAVYCSSLRFHPRPELFSALLLTLLLLFLIRERTTKEMPPEYSGTDKPRSLWIEVAFVFVLFVVWANFHGAVAIGLVLLAATAITELAQERFVRASWKWPLLLGVGVLAVCVNPYAFEYWQALRPVGGEMFERIDEWKPFWKTPRLNPAMIAGEFALVLLAFFCWLGNERRRWSQLAWLLVMTLLFLSARRHLWMLPIVCLSVIAANAQTLSTLQLRELLTPLARKTAQLLVTGVLLTAIARAISFERISSGPIAPEAPRAATKYFLRHELGARGHVFNDYENSSYLQWRFGGQPPLFIDLLNAYPDQLLFDYLNVVHANARGRKLLEERKIQTVILRTYKPDSSLAKLAKYLDENDTRWQRVYSAKDGKIWRRLPAPRAVGTTDF